MRCPSRGDEPKEEVVRNIDKKLKTWRTSNPTSKGGDGEAKEGERGSDTRARAKQRETRKTRRSTDLNAKLFFFTKRSSRTATR